MSCAARGIVLGAVLCLAFWDASAATSLAGLRDTIHLRQIRRHMRGELLDFTANHGSDRRIWSPSLNACRDLYVYLPPCYNPSWRYPVVFYLHGFAQDERSFLFIAKEIDEAIACGKLMPVIVVAVDGSISGRPGVARPSSCFVNSKAGRFEDYLMLDVWNWAHEHFSIRPEREAHVLAGASMGGGASFNLGLKHRDRIGVAVGVFPPLNLRWLDCHGRYMGNFDPTCWGWRTQLTSRHEVIARYLGGLITIRMGTFIAPLFGFNNQAVSHLAEHNPIEHLERFDIRNGDLAMYVAYGGRDQFNLDAQIESFLHAACQRGIDVTVDYDPRGRHDSPTAYRMLPNALSWLGRELQGYGPVPGP